MIAQPFFYDENGASTMPTKSEIAAGILLFITFALSYFWLFD